MRNFKELIVWRKSVELVVAVYRLTKDFPDHEKYGLASQMRRAATSVASNIAEGHMRRTDRDFKQFIAIARGSCAELETHAIIAKELVYLRTDAEYQLLQRIEEVAKMLSSLHGKLTG